MLAHLPKDLRQSQVGIAPPVTDMRGFPPRIHTPRSMAGTPPVAIIAELLEPRKHKNYSKITAKRARGYCSCKMLQQTLGLSLWRKLLLLTTKSEARDAKQQEGYRTAHYCTKTATAKSILSKLSGENRPSSVVGYQVKSNMAKGFANDVCQTFYNVGTAGENEKITLADIKVGGYDTTDPNILEGLTISFINGSGITETEEIGGGTHRRQFVWQDFTDVAPAGWYDENGGLLATAERIAELKGQGWDVWQSYFGDASNIDFKHGRGFRVRPSSDSEYAKLDFKLTFSGELHQGQTLVKDLDKGFANSCGNSTPVEIDLSQIVVGGYDTTDPNILEGLTISFINGSGITETEEIGGGTHRRQFVWQDFTDVAPAGWYDENGGLLATAERIAELKGQGWDVWQSYFGDASNIKFPSMHGFRVRPSSDSEYAKIAFTITLPSPMGN